MTAEHVARRVTFAETSAEGAACCEEDAGCCSPWGPRCRIEQSLLVADAGLFDTAAPIPNMSSPRSVSENLGWTPRKPTEVDEEEFEEGKPLEFSPPIGAAIDHKGIEAPSLLVTLNVYDLGQSDMVEALNGLGFGLGLGAYHLGLEVFAEEWSYGKRPGVYSVPPRGHQFHRFRCSIGVGEVSFTRDQVATLLANMKKTWRGADYSLLEHNCVHFVQELASRLGLPPLPAWVERGMRAAATMTAQVEGVLEMTGLRHTHPRPLGPKFIANVPVEPNSGQPPDDACLFMYKEHMSTQPKRKAGGGGRRSSVITL
eukprot:TRINITY_DN74481_c0_g1_i1.p1 TRINITY_DN74481_c0_g1~~TRINITY_DN74481_c0_g1_i1.p1  ORF type:complete len:314 (+),score=31.26 TRINITY_DN74481_c0_g1_i1:93-1034(+)